MVDLQETPPVPPEERGGNERAGWLATGALCVLVGWVGGVLANLILHRLAPSRGLELGPVWIGPEMGPYAWALFGLGIAVGAFGVVLFYLASKSPRAPLVLPGYPY